MNVAIILSGGTGKRFGTKLPKQYSNLCGRPVIDYVLESVSNTKTIDEIVLVIDKEYIKLINIPKTKKVHLVENGIERVNSVKNALDFIKNNLPETNNIIITQAVQPFVTANQVDEYIEKLNEYDVVVTAEKCVGEIFNIQNFEKINRNMYYFCQSPEAFKFDEIYKYLDLNSEFSELIYHYPIEPKIYYYLGMENNIKLTHQCDLEYAEIIMQRKKDK